MNKDQRYFLIAIIAILIAALEGLIFGTAVMSVILLVAWFAWLMIMVYKVLEIFGD